MVRFVIDIEAVASDPEAVNIILKTNSNQAVEAEEATAQRLLPIIRELLKSGFPESDEPQQNAA